MKVQVKLILLSIAIFVTAVTAGLNIALDGYNRQLASSPPLQLIDGSLENGVIQVMVLNSTLILDIKNNRGD